MQLQLNAVDITGSALVHCFSRTGPSTISICELGRIILDGAFLGQRVGVCVSVCVRANSVHVSGRVSQILLSHKTVAGEERGHFSEGRSGGSATT